MTTFFDAVKQEPDLSHHSFQNLVRRITTETSWFQYKHEKGEIQKTKEALVRLAHAAFLLHERLEKDDERPPSG